MLECLINDIDPTETCEWQDAILSVIRERGVARAQFLIHQLITTSRNNGIKINDSVVIRRDYVNTISVNDEYEYPGDLELESKIRDVVCWNAMMIVLRASKKQLELGGHISSFQSAATIYEVCFNHFFRASNVNDSGDLVYFQGHSSPGIYARAFLEGRLTEEQLDNFRQEVYKRDGLSSYPHPKLMPDFWQFPTVSMGLGAVSAIYQARFLKYLNNRNLKNTSHQTVYAFLGDGEMDEPESKGVLVTAMREKLDNLVFIVNCNLQRLDGPVVGNGKIINELENIFIGSGWEVIKVIWGGLWDDLLNRDSTGVLIKLMNETLDGDYQTFKSKNGAYIRQHFFGRYLETQDLVKNMNDDEIWSLNRGGHDPKKIYTALRKAKEITGKPVVVLIHTVKGYGMGESAEGMNIAHQVKNINMKEIYCFRDRLNLDITDDDVQSLPYINFSDDSKECIYLHERRKKLFGYLPKRLRNFTDYLDLPELKDFQPLLKEQKRKISTTIAFVRLLNLLLQHTSIKDRLVPIVADEARTFGMEGLFRKFGIYSSVGQQYTPQDSGNLIYYREDLNGQILQEGINELGALSSWLAAATSYSTNNYVMIPFYIFYSMFGFQRTGDLCWAAADQQARGFLIGGISGRTTLNGEGLQHADGHSHIYSLTIPSCVSYDLAFAYEVAVVVHDGLTRMYGSMAENIFYYLTITNEKYNMPSIPKGVEEGIKKGIYKLESFYSNKNCYKVQLMGSGAVLLDVLKAAEILFDQYEINSDVYSVTSFTELARDGQDCERWNMLHPMDSPRSPYVTSILNNSPVIVSTDYMKLFAEQIRKFVPTDDFFVLGTDGFGVSDSRENLRHYFEIDTAYIVVASLNILAKRGEISIDLVVKAIDIFHINTNKINPRLL